MRVGSPLTSGCSSTLNQVFAGLGFVHVLNFDVC